MYCFLKVFANGFKTITLNSGNKVEKFINSCYLTYAMTYVRKSLAEMLVDIGLRADSPATIEDIFITARGTIGLSTNAALAYYNTPIFRNHLKSNVPNEDDYLELYRGSGFGGVFDHLGTNSYYYGYDCESGKKIIIRYYFGREGVVIAVQDFGKGFDAKREMEILMDDNRQQERLCHNLGNGLKFFRRPEYEANIVSSQVEPTGTTVTIMYKYTKPKPS